MVKIFINNSELTNFIVSSPYKDTIDEELDKMVFQIKSKTRKTLHKNDKLRYMVGVSNALLIDKTFCIYDWIETLEGEYWLYEITCLSPTKLLENLIIHGMASTTRQMGYAFSHLREQFSDVVVKINKTLELETGIANILEEDDTLELLSFSANDFLWDGQQTVREILQDICDKADCLITATDFTILNNNIKSITLVVVKREKQGNGICYSDSDIQGGGLDDIKEKIDGLSISRDSNFNCGSVVSLTKNAIAKDNIQQAYTPARNDDLTIDDASDWHILTQEPIYSLNRVIAIVPSEVQQSTYVSSVDAYGNPTTSAISSGKYYGREIDITNYIVEKDVFDAMSITEQSKYLYFKRGEKGIYGLFKKYKSGLTGLYSTTAFINIINDIGNVGGYPQEAIKQGVVKINPLLKWDNSNNNWTTNYDYNIKSGAWQQNDFYDLNLANDTTLNTNKSKYSLFSINYQPYTDAVVKIEKQTTITNNIKNLSVLKNQSDRTIDAEKYYKSQQALINRLGNDEMTLDVMFNTQDLEAYYDNPDYHKNSFWELGDYITLKTNEKWTLTQREIENYGLEYIKARLTFSKNYNASNSAINVNRDKRLYGIPLSNFVDRYLLFNKPNDKSYTKIAIQGYDDFTNAPSSISGYYILDLVRIGADSNINYVGKCMDNYSVGIERTKYSSTIVNIGIRYADIHGTGNYMYARLLTDADYNLINISDYSKLPFIPTSNLGVGDEVSFVGIAKDKMERLIFIVR